MKDGTLRRQLRHTDGTRRLVGTHHISGFAARLEDLNGVVRVSVLHGDAVDHHNLVFGAEGQTKTKASQVHIYKISRKRKMLPVS